MREIKVIVWANNKMWGPINLKEHLVNPGGQFPEDCIARECTGLKDKNGGEICELDIVSLVVIEDELKNHETATIAVVRWDDSDAGFYYDTGYDGFCHAKPWFVKDVEVIGNIYQDSHLLEDS